MTCMTTSDPQPLPPLSQRDADFLLLIFQGFRAIAALETRSFAPPATLQLPVAQDWAPWRRVPRAKRFPVSPNGL